MCILIRTNQYTAFEWLAMMINSAQANSDFQMGYFCLQAGGLGAYDQNDKEIEGILWVLVCSSLCPITLDKSLGLCSQPHIVMLVRIYLLPHLPYLYTHMYANSLESSILKIWRTSLISVVLIRIQP